MDVQRNPFARGAYKRLTVCNPLRGTPCLWCGQTPQRLYQYAWQSDDASHAEYVPLKYVFCNFQCYKAYYN
jgi:hypothetical protein